MKTKFISLLRGINVSGQKKIKMVDLKILYESLGFTNVQTYIQSGNVIFCSDLSKQKIIEEIEEIIVKTYNFSVKVFVVTEDEIKKIIKGNPFLKKETVNIDKLYITIFESKLDKNALTKLTELNFNGEEFIVNNNLIYLNFENGYGNSKLNNNFFENKLKNSATTRNWKTMNKLLELVNTTKCN